MSDLESDSLRRPQGDVLRAKSSHVALLVALTHQVIHHAPVLCPQSHIPTGALGAR